MGVARLLSSRTELRGSTSSGCNQWPERPASFKPTMEQWIAKMKVLGMAVMHA